jgi:Icc-related predicted phosphoesterase
MKIFAFSDWRVQSLDKLVDLVNQHKPDAILYAGDDLDRFVPEVNNILLRTTGHLISLSCPEYKAASRECNKALSQKVKRLLPKLALPFNNALYELKIPFYLVNGNDDFAMTVDGCYFVRLNEGRYFYGDKFYRLAEDKHGRVTLLEDSPFLLKIIDLLDNEVSIDSGIYGPISASFGDFTIAKGKESVSVFGVECQYGRQNKIVNVPREYADIYLSHLPPLGCLDLSSRFGVEHIGSKKLLAAIIRYSPKLVICGHSHMWGGNIAKIGDTTVVNISSHDDPEAIGNYALIDTSDWSIDVKATERSQIHAMPGMRALRRRCVDLRNAEKLSGLYGGSEADLLESLDYVETFDIDTTLVRERLKSLKWKKPKITRPITLNPYNQAFVDVETGLAKGGVPGELWLVGIWYQGGTTQFTFPSEKKAFLKYIRDNNITDLASWTQYDANALRPVFEKAGIPMYFIDACQRTRNCVVWHTYSLHDFYNALFTTSQAEDLIDGYKAGLYADHLIIPGNECPYCSSPQDTIEQIKERNRVDIKQMIDICIKLWEG